MLLPIQNQLSYLTQIGNKFLRRIDLAYEKRLEIAINAYMAINYNQWGRITELSREFNISRTFVYTLASKLNKSCPIIFGTPFQNDTILLNKEIAFQYMGSCLRKPTFG